jgi:hypothetical protein
MKAIKSLLLASLVLFIISCENDEVLIKQEQITQDVINRISELGFSTDRVLKIEEGFLVEGDIILTNEDLNPLPRNIFSRQAPTETENNSHEVQQYRTNNLVSVSGTSRTISVSLELKRIPAGYSEAVDEMIRRFNSENLTLKFSRVASGGNIRLIDGTGSYLASAGFPTSSGDPYNLVKINSRAIGSGTSNSKIQNIATILAHEVGHCIGFRHTDYMNRAYSCGGSATNEGDGGVGANHINGTPTGPDDGSWMLSCIGSGANRPFNANDKTALNALY